MEFPEISLEYLRTLTDCTGIIQHGVHSVPNRHTGYTTDDNVRALIVTAQHYGRTRTRQDLDLAITYVSYVHLSKNVNNRFHNFMSYAREFLDEDGTEDCYGRTMWACGYTASSELPDNIRIVATKMFDDCIVWAGDLNSPRARAYTMLGMCEYLRKNPDKGGLREKIEALADSLLSGLHTYRDRDWYWYEPYLTYGNAILPLGMLAAAEATGKKTYFDAARGSTDFLTETVIIGGRLELIGNDGWYFRGKNRAWYDQQAIDAGYMVYLCMTAYRVLGDEAYLKLAKISYSWFFGNNRSGQWVYDPVTRGCFDAVTPAGVNLNQGAESIICFLLAQLAVEDYKEIMDSL